MNKDTEKTIIRMNEWQTISPDNEVSLFNFFLYGEDRHFAEKLTRHGIIEIIEQRHGVRIFSKSYVGYLKLGDLEIHISPKISGFPLLSLFRYAYKLKNLFINEKMLICSEITGVQDLLILQLINEVKNLISRGMVKKYLEQKRFLDSPRGKIDFQTIVKNDFTLRNQLPCIIHPRTWDCLLNQVIKAGIEFAIRLTDNRQIEYECRQLAKYLDEFVSDIPLNRFHLNSVRRNQNRLTSSYNPALTLIEILMDSQGVIFEDQQEKVPIPGFLFDMNRLFQGIISRFLNSHLCDYKVRDEYSLKSMMKYLPDFNPQKRRDPMPRPDFVVMKDGKITAILDAKYRDLWEKNLPREMLYQLGMYALCQRDVRKAAILYPTMSESAREGRIQISDPTYGNKLGKVVIRPLNLNLLSELINLPDSSQNIRRKEKYADYLAFGEDLHK